MSTPGTLALQLQSLVAGWRSRGVAVAVVGGRLVVRPLKGALPPDVTDLAAHLEPELIAVVEGRQPDTRWRAQLRLWPVEQLEEFEERAAIREFDGEMPRALAELVAFKDIAARTRRG